MMGTCASVNKAATTTAYTGDTYTSYYDTSVPPTTIRVQIVINDPAYRTRVKNVAWRYDDSSEGFQRFRIEFRDKTPSLEGRIMGSIHYVSTEALAPKLSIGIVGNRRTEKIVKLLVVRDRSNMADVAWHVSHPDERHKFEFSVLRSLESSTGVAASPTRSQPYSIES